MRAAADLEDTTEKHPVTPGPVVPARELLADMLFEQGQPAEALAEAERVLAVAPRRFNAERLAATAAEKAGDQKRADAHSAVALALAEGRPLR